jgi:hypothetical protein
LGSDSCDLDLIWLVILMISVIWVVILVISLIWRGFGGLQVHGRNPKIEFATE